MKLLLDTHIWIWNVGAPEKLRKRVAEAIQNEENELWLSPISSARVFDLTLVTADPRLLELKSQGIAILSNR
jgi:PIN domain nuclease of toxin-antitoxin system